MSTTPSSRPDAGSERRAPALFVAAALALACAAPAHALSSDRDKDLEVRADSSKMVSGAADKPGPAEYALFLGNVRIEQGSLKASGNEARVFDSAGTGDSASRRLVLTGAPARLEQMQDGDGGKLTARAATIDYDDGSGIAVLTGEVVVIQEGKSEFRGPRMVYDTNTGAMEGGSASPGSEVHMIFKPKKRAAQPTSGS